MTAPNAVLDRLRGGLIVSVQADASSVLDTPETIALLARCAAANGAAGVRVESAARIAAVRAAVGIPIVGIVKRAYPGFEPYITTTEDEVAAVAAAGAEIVVFDATARPRFGAASVAGLVVAARARGCLAMADCATAEDALAATAAGADIVATTLAGYTAETRGRELPAFDLLAAIAAHHPFAVCEGGIGSPAEARRAFALGAAAIVVGTAITNVDVLVRRFAESVPHRWAGSMQHPST
ncbi:MAG: N-acetylmannosamine-6-phosphate 2-epimerase [Vulcanimicrobiaceae bacterium]